MGSGIQAHRFQTSKAPPVYVSTSGMHSSICFWRVCTGGRCIPIKRAIGEGASGLSLTPVGAHLACHSPDSGDLICLRVSSMYGGTVVNFGMLGEGRGPCSGAHPHRCPTPTAQSCTLARCLPRCSAAAHAPTPSHPPPPPASRAPSLGGAAPPLRHSLRHHLRSAPPLRFAWWGRRGRAGGRRRDGPLPPPHGPPRCAWPARGRTCAGSRRISGGSCEPERQRRGGE